MQDECKRGALALSVSGNAHNTKRRLDRTRRAFEDGAEYSWGGQTDTTPGSSEHTTHAKTKNVALGTSYQQHCRYFITRKKDLTCPLELFRRDLIKQLKEWQAAGDKIILFTDHNKHVTKGALGKTLGDRDGLDFREAIIYHTGKAQGPLSSEDQNPLTVCGYLAT
jgi:hypothetical protein